MEKTLFAQAAEIRGKAAPGVFAFTFQTAPSEEKLKQTRGTLFSLIQVEAESEDKGLSLGRELFENLKESFYQGSGSNLKALEGALESLKENLKQREIKGEVIAATLWGSVLYVAKSGNTGLVLARGGGAKEIDFAKAASGALVDKDTIFLTNEGFLKTTDLEVLGKTSEKSDFEEAVSSLQSEYREKEATALAVRLSVQEPIEKPQEILIADLDKQEKGSEAIADFRRGFRLKLPIWRWQVEFLTNVQVGIKVIAAKLAPYVRDFIRKAAFLILSPWLPRPPGVLEDEASRKRKRVIQVVALLAAVLLLSIVVGSVSRVRNASSEKQANMIASVENKLSEAEKIKDSNPAKAASLLSSAEEELGSLPAKDSQVASLRQKLDTLSAEISRIFPANLDTFVDLSSQKGGIAAKSLKLASGFLLISDSGTSSVYRVSLKDKGVSVLVSEQKDLQNIATSKDLLYFQTKSEIRKVDIQTKAEKKVAAASSKWQKLIGADTYRDNLYLLDAGAKQIWKYVPASADALSGPQTYFSESFSETPVSFAVDGSVWVATKADLLKFFAGKKQKFEIKNLPRSFSEIADVYTKEGFANLYILDKGVGGLFVIEKASGKYSALYTEDKIKEASSVAVDETNRVVYALIGNTVYSFNLK